MQQLKRKTQRRQLAENIFRHNTKVKSAVCTDYKTENKQKMIRIVICLAVDQ